MNNPRQLFSGLHVTQLTALEEAFATLTPSGWVIPEWLTWLRQELTRTTP